MDLALRLHPDQQELTPAQKAEARRFAAERIQSQFSTEPADEQKAEAFLHQAYRVAGLAPPQRIHWLDGPLQLVAVLTPPNIGHSVWDRVVASIEPNIRTSRDANMRAHVRDRIRDRILSSLKMARVAHSVPDSGWNQGRVWDRVVELADALVGELVRASVWDRDTIHDRDGSRYYHSRDSIRDSARAYLDADWLALHHFLAVYLAPNELQALAQFNERVSGYWLGQEVALVVRRPRLLCRDEQGRLHNETGKCLEYRDGWGFYAWHGVRVPERVILAPDNLTREDFLNESNVEMRRVIQERMGGRFVSELRGVVLDSGPRGTLYEVELPKDDPERVARYVQVQDTSTARQYFVRVPPTIRTAAEAVAWSFGLAVEAYAPAQET